MEAAKEQVKDFWQEASCGEVYAVGETAEEQFRSHRAERYRLEPYILGFARFGHGRGQDVLEIGVGMGADHAEWAQAQPRRLFGIDLTPAAIDWTRRRLSHLGLSSELRVGDAEHLDFPDDSFDIVYSWGVLHHTPDTSAAVAEVHRVLRPGGTARIMIYHRPSFVGLLLWLRYGLLAGQPRRSMSDLYAAHLESPGTQGFTVAEGRELMAAFSDVDVRSQVGFGDLLEGEVGQRHTSMVLRVMKRVWPRPLIRRLNRLGLMLLIEARK